MAIDVGKKEVTVKNVKYEPKSEIATWFLGWLVVVALHVGFAYAIARLEGASLYQSGMGMETR